MLNGGFVRHFVQSPCVRILTILIGASSVLLLEPAHPAAAALQFPRRLEEYITKFVKLTPAQQTQLAAGHPMTKLLDSDPSKEVSVFGAVWVNAPLSRYVAAMRDIERFEKGPNFRVTKKISNPPRPEDFALLTVPDDDARDLRTCKVGACELKLGREAIGRLRTEVDWAKPTARADVERLARAIALEYVRGYLEGGNARLAVYRDGDRPTFVSDEFASMIDRMPEMAEFLPDLKRYLLAFPKATLTNSESFIYWQEAKFGLKPTIRINHVVITEQPTHVAVASKMLYASHYFWTALELRVLVPEPARGNGFWFVSVNRSRSDGLSGFTGRIIRGKVRGEAEEGMGAVLRATKLTLEGTGK
jgi:hypothetical protein